MLTGSISAGKKQVPPVTFRRQEKYKLIVDTLTTTIEVNDDDDGDYHDDDNDLSLKCCSFSLALYGWTL